MKVSSIGLIETKITKLDNQFPVQDMLLQTGQIEQFASGIYAYGHIPFLVKKNINDIIIKTLTKYGCSLINLPLLQPENIWINSGRLDRYVSEDVMFRCLTDKGNFCLAPTAEEAVVEFAKSRLTSYKNLPTTYFQIGEKFRNEIRTRGYLLRGKSFEMMDAYSFGKDEKDLDNLKSKKACELGHIFQLGEKYSKSMDTTYIAQDGKPKYYSMGCYGIGVSRTLAMIYENSIVRNDKNEFLGISLPVNLTPYIIYIIAKTDDKEKLKYANNLYKMLISDDIPVLYDDRDYLSIGAKLKDSKITGIPYTCVLGNTLNDGYITVENNKTGEKINIDKNEFVEYLVKFQTFRKKKITLESIVKNNIKTFD